MHLRAFLAMAALVVGANAACDAARGQICDTGGDCPPNQFCAFAISDGCNATGQCTPRTASSAPGCGMTQYCGCDGQTVFDSCLLASGVVELPVMSATPGACVDAGSVAEDGGEIDAATGGVCPDGCSIGSANVYCDAALSCYCPNYPATIPIDCTLGASSLPAPDVAVYCCN